MSEGTSLNVWNIIIPIITLLVGVVLGFVFGVFYLRKQMTRIQNDPEMLQKMAKQMGYNMNKQQLQRAQQMLQKQKSGPRRK
jgi:hypothetical protein